MKKTTHIIDHLLFLMGSLVFLVFLSIFKGQKLAVFFAVCGFVLFYLSWAAYHHHRSSSLTLKNMLEYVLIGFTVLVFIIIFLLF